MASATSLVSADVRQGGYWLLRMPVPGEHESRAKRRLSTMATVLSRGIVWTMSEVVEGERRQRACEAALEVAAGLGIGTQRAIILQDWNNTIVRLVPASIVAKVGTSHFRDARLESLERELAVASHLAARRYFSRREISRLARIAGRT